MITSFSHLSFRWLGPVLLIALIGTSPVLADSHGDARDQAQIKYRQTLMSGVGANMGAIGDILKNGLDLPGHLESHARHLAEDAKLIGPAFQAAVAEGATDAQPAIWTDWAGFEVAIADFEKAARGLEKASTSGDPAAVGAAVKGLGQSCGGCHDSYRKPKEESYKNR